MSEICFCSYYCSVFLSFSLVTVVSGCNPLFVESNQTAVLGSTFYAAANTSNDCGSACLFVSNCQGYDWNYVKYQCFLSIPPLGQRNSGTQFNFIHYDLYYSCSNSTASSSPTPSSTGFYCPEVLYTWTAVENTNYASGLPVNDVTNLEDCQLLCIANRTCLGVDYTSTNYAACHMIVTEYEKSVAISSPTNPWVHYSLSRKCYITSTTWSNAVVTDRSVTITALAVVFSLSLAVNILVLASCYVFHRQRHKESYEKPTTIESMSSTSRPQTAIYDELCIVPQTTHQSPDYLQLGSDSIRSAALPRYPIATGVTSPPHPEVANRYATVE